MPFQSFKVLFFHTDSKEAGRNLSYLEGILEMKFSEWNIKEEFSPQFSGFE